MEKIIVSGIVAFFLAIVGGLMLTDWYIATAKDPVATACALGRDKACVLYAMRKQ